MFIGLPNPTKLIELIDDKELANIAMEVEKELKSAIDKAK